MGKEFFERLEAARRRADADNVEVGGCCCQERRCVVRLLNLGFRMLWQRAVLGHRRVVLPSPAGSTNYSSPATRRESTDAQGPRVAQAAVRRQPLPTSNTGDSP